MSSNLPISYSELFKISTKFGIPSQFISFSNVTFESDKYICIRYIDPNTEKNSVMIIDVANQSSTTHKIDAESAIMNPKTKVIALKASGQLQVINLEMKSVLSEYKFNNETVSFWKWISPNTIALVTENSVYHWSMQGSNTKPKKIFDKMEKMNEATIISYKTSSDEKWCLLIGLTRVDNVMTGIIQFYCVDLNSTQILDGDSGLFIDYKINGKETTIVGIAQNTQKSKQLALFEVPQKNQAGYQKKAGQIQFANGDIVVSTEANQRLGLIYIITLKGVLFVYEIETATCILSTRISQDTIFTTTLDSNSNGILGINAKVGQVLSVNIDEKKIIPYISDNFDKKLALLIAARGELEGAEELYSQSFNELLNKGDIEGAIKVAAESPSGILRSPNTIQKLQKIGKFGNSQKPALSLYFTYIIGIDKLNKIESVELSKIVLQKNGGIDYIKQLISDNKIEFSEPLGDLIKSYDNELAIKIYLDAKAHSKIVESLLSKGEYQKALIYADNVGYDADYLDMFKKLVQSHIDESVKFAISKYKKGIDPNTVIDIYTQQSKIKQATAYLLGILQGDKKEDSELQTKLFEINLLYSPLNVAESIFKQQMYTHYDRNQVAILCEKAKLYTRALENYSSMDDLKRVMNNAQYIDTEWLINFFQTIEEPDQFELLSHLLKVNLKAHINIVVSVAQNSTIAPEKMIELFETYKTYEGIYAYLNNSIDSNQDPDIVFKYIEAATKIGQFQEVERVTRKNEYYDPKRTKEFLKEARLKDMAPLINVCDKHDFIQELIQYLFSEQKLKYIEAFIKQRPLKTPQVIGTLLDCDASEDFIKNLLAYAGNMCPVDNLVQEVEKRNRLKILLQWLESRVEEGSQEPAAHNALAKIYVDVNNNADKFLQNNQYYDSKIVGKYCEKKYPNLALIAYIRGECDLEIIDLTNKNGLFKQQAKYLVKKKDIGLWEHALDKENKYRRQLIDHVVQTALPESNVTEEVSITVKAFMKADLPNELIELLEKIILNGSNMEFKSNKNLQNLLILTAVKADPKRVMEYIHKLDNYDSLDIAKIALSSDLFEVAFEIYNKFQHYTLAIRVLIEKLKDIEKAQNYADKIKQSECYSILGNAQLANGLVKEAISSFILADDASSYHNVISVAEENGNYEELIVFLRMAKKKIQDSHIDTELVYSFAKLSEKTNDFKPLSDMEEFLKGTTMAKIQVVGDKCFKEGLFEAARILYTNINNFSSLASTYVQLKRNKDAVQAATKANTPKIWKEVLFSCVEAQEFVLAQNCGLALIKDSDELEEVTNHYEKYGYFNELVDLIEKGISFDSNNSSLNTTLSELYAKFRQEKLMSQLSRCWKFGNPMRLLNACRENACWSELVFLHQSYEEHDDAIKIMMKHPDSFNLTVFNDNIVHVSSIELYYQSIDFFLDEQPDLLVSLLLHIKDKINHEKVCSLFTTKNLPLIKKYLEHVQDSNLLKVNESLNYLYIEEEDYDSLRNSVTKYNNFNQTELAKKLEFHELLEFRRIATLLYKLNKKWSESIELSLKDKLYKDAMQTAAESNSTEVAEKLLNHFVKNQLNECFAACLYTCYDLLKPDVVLELAWRNNIQDMSMPYLIQVLKEFTLRVENLEKVKEENEKKIEKLSKIQNDTFVENNEFQTQNNVFDNSNEWF